MQLAHQAVLASGDRWAHAKEGAVGGTCLVLSRALVQYEDEANCSVKVCPACAVSYEMTCV